jgi:heat shock protein HslJ
MLKGMEGNPLDRYPGYENLESPQIEIKVVEMQYAGSDGCNRVIGGLIAVDESEIKFGVGAGTRKACPNMEIPDRFNRLIQQVKSYRVERGHLFLFDADGKELFEFVKTD